MIKTIVFDFGGVLVKDTTKPLEQYYHYNKLSLVQKQKYDKAFDLAETGKISFDQLFERIHKILAKNLTAMEVQRYLLDNAQVLPPWQLARKLSKKQRVIVFSNNFLGWPEAMAKGLKIDLRLFPFLNSATVGLRKPGIKYYQYLIKKFKLVPSETVFIDDQKHNLVPATKLGMKAFWYQGNVQQLKNFLHKLGIK